MKILKNSLLLLFTLLTFLYALIIYSRPVLFNYVEKVTIYTKNSSSTAQFYTVQKSDFLGVENIKGESCVFEKASLKDIVKKFNLKIIKTEVLDGVTCYYAKSDSLPYSIKLNGLTVNAQIAVTKDRIVFGSPIIFGSY